MLRRLTHSLGHPFHEKATLIVAIDLGYLVALFVLKRLHEVSRVTWPLYPLCNLLYPCCDAFIGLPDRQVLIDSSLFAFLTRLVAK